MTRPLKVTVEIPNHVVCTIKQVLKNHHIKYTSEELKSFLESDLRTMYSLSFEINLEDAVVAYWKKLSLMRS